MLISVLSCLFAALSALFWWRSSTIDFTKIDCGDIGKEEKIKLFETYEHKFLCIIKFTYTCLFKYKTIVEGYDGSFFDQMKIVSMLNSLAAIYAALFAAITVVQLIIQSLH